eukprot:gnl/TRDRNA2_/TRDRNA2_178056_c0_seq33.p1 gnl/TRDRNA2_/TRDRNA2_178056_c0~~gnl/TRDRNA2_/TRDRNA2_178056_c0_seq33.p1  ORF type:complete len:789 (+),score=-50.84 gnl/TRDRNA2_/TRDRNA2_178056_c0_seq33:329-2695(+)
MTLEYPKKQLICPTRRVNSYKKPTEIALANDITWDAGNDKYQELHALFSTLSVCGHIPKALALLKDLVSEARIDVLATLQHKPFFDSAKKKKLGMALDFLDIMPNVYVRHHTLNMALSVSAHIKSTSKSRKVLEYLRSHEIKLDSPLFVNLLSVLARYGDAEKTFELLKHMKDKNLKPCIKAYTSVITSYNYDMAHSRTNKNPRRKIILLERAFALLGEMHKKKIELDKTAFNALLSLCEKTGEIKRIKELYRLMVNQGLAADVITYCIIIRGLSRNGRPDDAMEVFERALLDGQYNSAILFASAVEASDKTTNKSRKLHDIREQIYALGLKPDPILLKAQIRAAGRAGEVDYAFQIYNDLEGIGLEPTGELRSAMIIACVQGGEKERGFEILARLARRRNYSDSEYLQEPTVTIDGVNALAHAYAREGSLENIYKILVKALKLKIKPNESTYGAVIKACFECEESELAMCFYDNLKHRGGKLNYFLAKNLLKICQWQCQLIRADLKPDGWAPSCNHIGNLILQLMGGKHQHSHQTKNWTDLSLRIYREAIQAGVKPQICILNLLVSCMRTPVPLNTRLRNRLNDEYWIQKARQNRPKSLGLEKLTRGVSSEDSSTSHIFMALNFDDEGSWDPRVFQLIRESIASGVVPAFSVSRERPELIDLRHLPPQISEVYFVYFLSSIHHFILNEHRTERINTTIILVVPPFNPNAVLTLSGRVTPITEKVYDPVLGNERGSSQGLGIAAMLRRLRLHYTAYPREGQILIKPADLQRWLFTALNKKLTPWKRFH